MSCAARLPLAVAIVAPEVAVGRDGSALRGIGDVAGGGTVEVVVRGGAGDDQLRDRGTRFGDLAGQARAIGGVHARGDGREQLGAAFAAPVGDARSAAVDDGDEAGLWRRLIASRTA